MANFTEEELETIDTKPTRGRVIGLAIIAYLIVACAMWVFLYQFGTIIDVGSADEVDPIVGPSAYLVPEDDFLLAPNQIALANMEQTHTTAELANYLGVNSNVNIIYLHPAMVNEVSTQLIQQQFQAGRLIVAINTPYSVLAAKLGVPAGQSDLSLETLASTPLSVSALQRRTDESLLEYTTTFADFEEMIVTINTLQ